MMRVLTQSGVLMVLSVMPAVLASKLAAADSEVPPKKSGEKVDVAVVDVKPYTFTRPHKEARGIRVVLQQLEPPKTAKSNMIIYSRVSAILDKSLASDWKIVAFRAYESEARASKPKPVKSFHVVPSRCNNFCNGAEKYDIPRLESGARYDMEYLIWPVSATADQADALKQLRRRKDRAITVNAWFEFAETSNAYRSLAATPADN